MGWSMVQTLEKDNYATRTLIREIVLSVPFSQRAAGRHRTRSDQTNLNFQGLNAWKQDAPSHLKQ